MKKLILITILFAFINNTSVNAQTKKKEDSNKEGTKIFYLDREVNDSIDWHALGYPQLKSYNKNLEIVSYTLNAKVNNVFKETKCTGKFFDASLREVVDGIKRGDFIYIDKIVAKDGTSRRTYKGFKVYVK